MKPILMSLLRIAIALLVIFTAVGIWLSRSMGGAHDSSMRIAMKSDLRILAELQKKHRDSTGSYASELASLGTTPNTGVNIFDFAADTGGWKASARHSRLTGRSCVIWDGNLDPAAHPATEQERRTPIAGEPVCDGDRKKPAG